jgi:transposase InsO family protein
MRWKSHVRFGERAGETHPSRAGQGALRSDPDTYVKTHTGWVYVAFVDVFSRMVVGWPRGPRQGASG